MSDQDKISPYSISTISSTLVMRMKKNINQRIISWFNAKFPNQHHENCMANSKENFLWDLGSEGLKRLLHIPLHWNDILPKKSPSERSMWTLYGVVNSC